MKASKSSSCKTTVALSWSQEQVWDRGTREKRAIEVWAGVSAAYCANLFSSVALHPPFLPPPCTDLILFIWRGLSKWKIIRTPEGTNCFLSIWKFHCFLQDLETGALLQFRRKIPVEVALFCLCIKKPGRALQELPVLFPISIFIIIIIILQLHSYQATFSTSVQQDSKGLCGIRLKICSQLAKYFFLKLLLLVVRILPCGTVKWCCMSAYWINTCCLLNTWQ